MKPSRTQEIYAPKDAAIHPSKAGRRSPEGTRHRHYMGTVTPERFTSYEALYDRFEQEWQAIAIKFVNGEAI
mgnify:CR=1 FL=1